MTDKNAAKADDWEVAAYFSAGGGEILGGTYICFTFRSKTIDARADFDFFGIGATVGALPVGVTFDIDRVSDCDFSSIKCDNPFSLDDLDITTGRVTSATWSGAFGGSVVCISAGFYPSLFNSQNVLGFCQGVDMSLDFMRGIWKKIGATNKYELPKHIPRCCARPKATRLPATLNKKKIEEAKTRR